MQPDQIGELFSYKAEWLNERLFELYREPEYFPEMTAESPCVLIGGRGTGKTTVLRGLSYQGQFALNGCNREGIAASRFFGLYYKVNTNRTTAFSGRSLSEAQWIGLFAHYLNLLMCEIACKFLIWYDTHLPGHLIFDSGTYDELSASLHIPAIRSFGEFGAQLRVALRRFEGLLNNIDQEAAPPLSMQGVPVDILMEALHALPAFKGKVFFFLLDEYENFLDYQQQVVNTLIKHCSPLYSFKIGVRELGWRRKTTLNEAEQLISPADYVRINIAEKLSGTVFAAFARDVCDARLEKLKEQGLDVLENVEDAFPGLTEDEEAELLGVRERNAELAIDMGVTLPAALAPLEQYFVYTWALSRQLPIDQVTNTLLNPDNSWRDKHRYGNYKHSLLFSLRRGKTGIRKHYAGWEIFLKLAANNIRYLLELVDNSFGLHMKAGGSLGHPVSPQIQTKAAQAVGRKNLSELEGLTIFGAQLTKLLLSLGRVFQVMASDPFAHTPEVNQFHLDDDVSGSNSSIAVEKLLTTAVMHLALVRTSGTKLADESDTREYDYAVHPIFSAFFVFSYRRKRKMLLRNQELLGLVHTPQESIQGLLARNNRSTGEPLPEQAMLFEGFYGPAR